MASARALATGDRRRRGSPGPATAAAAAARYGEGDELVTYDLDSMKQLIGCYEDDAYLPDND